MYEAFFDQQLNMLHREKRYRTFIPFERAGGFPEVIWKSAQGDKPVTLWCSNDYLGMALHPGVVASALKVVALEGVGSGGTRNISGTSYYHERLEKAVAQFHRKEAALLFTSGYVANEATLSTLAGHLKDCVVFSDERNHASIIQGIRQARCEKVIFPHSDPSALEAALKRYPKEQPKLIVFEGVYSMDGDKPPITAFCDLAKKYNALTYLDEVHAVGLYGQTGAGIAEESGEAHRIDIIQGTFSKALGVTGGYIAASKSLVDFVRSTASSFIFTTSLPPATVAAAHASLDILKTPDHPLRLAFHHMVNETRTALLAAGLPLMSTQSHILPLLIGDAALCSKLSAELLNDWGVYLQPINYPTVPRGAERLRITPTPGHTPDMLAHLIGALKAVFAKKALKKAA